jgi:hypothetical protein
VEDLVVLKRVVRMTDLAAKEVEEDQGDVVGMEA